MTNNIHFIIGGARSGKSTFAEQQAIATNKPLVYCATAQALDTEMVERIAAHQHTRESHTQQWTTVESPIELAKILQEYQFKNCSIVVDCLTLWLSNCLHHQCLPEQQQLLIDTLESYSTSDNTSSLYIVSNEVGGGIVPLGELSRQFVDASGFLHQKIASIASQVTLITVGIPQVIKL